MSDESEHTEQHGPDGEAAEGSPDATPRVDGADAASAARAAEPPTAGTAGPGAADTGSGDDAPSRVPAVPPAAAPSRPGHFAPLRRLPAALFAALRRALASPGVLLLFLAVNLGAAALVVMPLRTLLADELDSNLYGEAMQTEASWRWFDTVERKHPEAVGNYQAWSALFSDRGVRLSDLGALSGPPAAIALAGLLLFLLHGPLHVGWLAAARSRLRPTAAKVAGRAVEHGAMGLVLAALAGVGYVAVYAAVFVAPADLLARLAEGLQSERLHVGLVALRLGLTVLLFAVVKVFFDLAKVGLAERGPWGLGGALALAGRQTLRHGAVYLLLYVLLAVAVVGVTAVWWVVSGPLVPKTWLGIVILFALHQVFVTLRIGLRLAGLRAMQDLVLP